MSRRRLAGLSARTAAIVLGLVAVRLALPWVYVFYDRWVPITFARPATTGLLLGLRGLYGLLVVAASVCLVVAVVLLGRGRRGRGPVAARLLALGLSTLIGLGLTEAAAAAWLAQRHRPPGLPTEFPEPTPPGEATLAVVGESGAMGVPYDPWLSIGQMIAWQVERAVPGKRVRVDMRAGPGICLETALLALIQQKRKPDAILLYAGHNEFHGRFGFAKAVRHYNDEGPRPPRGRLLAWAERHSHVFAMIDESLQANTLDQPPPAEVGLPLVGHPACTPAEVAFLLSEFRRHLENFVGYCERIGALPILVIPPGNEADYPPTRSVVTPETPPADRAAFADDFRRARALETTDPARAVAAHRDLLRRQPGFAESHFRLGRLLERSGRWAEADRHYRLARDLDAFPIRCTGDFQDVYRAVAARHPGVILVDGPEVLRRIGAHGLLGDDLFHDPEHPTLLGYVALAEEALAALKARRAFGWPESAPAPRLDPAECAEHFGLDAAAWSEIFARTASIHHRFGAILHDPSESEVKIVRNLDAARRAAEGEPPGSLGIPGLGLPAADAPAEARDGSRTRVHGPRTHPGL